jgi:hypothetical protein
MMKKQLVIIFLPLLITILTISLMPTFIVLAGGRNIPAQGVYYSLNWSGYVVATSLTSPSPSVTNVSASWTVPTVAKPPGSGYSVIFVGIGGFFDGDYTLIQVGTAQFIQGRTTYYFAWYELLPGPMIEISSTDISVEPGDVISAFVALHDDGDVIGPDPTDKWNITIVDDDGGRFSIIVTYESSRLSAEWIVERPSFWTPGGYRLLQLANYGSVTFTDAQTIIDATTYYIYFAPDKDTITMVQGARILSAVTSPVTFSSPGTFTVTYKP